MPFKQKWLLSQCKVNDETHFKFIFSVQTKNQCSTYLSQALAHQRMIHLHTFSPQFTFQETKHCSANEHTHTHTHMSDSLLTQVESARSKANLVRGLLLGKYQNTEVPSQTTDFPLTQKHLSKDSPPSTSMQTLCHFFGGVTDLGKQID